MKNSKELVVFVVAAAIFLGVWAAWRVLGREEGTSLNDPGSCEARCLARDPECALLAAPQGGFPSADLPEGERAAMCNGLCYVLRVQGKGAANACTE